MKREPYPYPQPPRHLRAQAVDERLPVGVFRRFAHEPVHHLRVLADEDAPALFPHTVEDHRGGFGRGHRRGVAELFADQPQRLADQSMIFRRCLIVVTAPLCQEDP
jgi:hypothetical protein